jgi:hypothetical protein
MAELRVEVDLYLADFSHLGDYRFGNRVSPKSSSSGSTERNRKVAGASRNTSILGAPYLRSSARLRRGHPAAGW